MDINEVKLIAGNGKIVNACSSSKPDLDDDTLARLKLLEEYDFGFLLLGLSPRRLIRDGRLFDNEQVLPLLLYFGQWDHHCKYWASEIMRQWLVFNPDKDGFEGVDDEKALEFRDYFLTNYAIPLIEEFREFVAICMMYPEKNNAPSGPIDMVWHSFILHTEEYWKFGEKIWKKAPHIPPEVRETWLENSPKPYDENSFSVS